MVLRLARLFLILLPMTLTLTSCFRDGDDDCDKTVEENVVPDEIHGAAKIFVSMDKLEFLFAKSGYVMEDVDLRADLNGAKPATPLADIGLAMNGIKLSRKDGKPACESLTLNPSEGYSESHFKLHKLALNGGVPFD